jgi:cytochrome c
MKITTIVYLTAALVFAGNLQAETAHGSKAEAQAMAKKAVDLLKSAGKEKAFPEFNQKGGKFSDRDLYVFVSDFTGKTVSHGANEKLIGRDMSQIKDVDGKAFVAAMVEQGKTGKAGWTDYKWPNPQTKEIEAKSTYCEPVESMIVCVGVYK